MKRINRLGILAAGCFICIVISLGCWFFLDSVFAWERPYFLITIANLIGYIGHGIANQVIRMHLKQKQRR